MHSNSQLPRITSPSFRVSHLHSAILAQRLPSAARQLPPIVHSAVRSTISSTAPKEAAHFSAASGLRTPPGEDLDGAMGSISHLHHAHQSHNPHHHSHHPALLADFEGRHHVGSTSQVPPSASSMMTEADRKRAILSEAQASLHMAPSSAVHHTHNHHGHSHGHNHSHSHSHNHSSAVRAMNNGVDALHAQPAQQHAAYPLQPPVVDRLSSVNDFLTPPTANDARQAAMARQSHSSGLSPNQSTPPITVSQSAAVSGTNSAANGPTHRKTISITEKDSLAMVIHSPEVPRCISPKGGSISDFTAEMTCLFWFEPPSVYLQADNIEKMSLTAWVPRLSNNAIPGDNFRTWVSRMINTTQVTQNVILLALLFIYRLKSLNVVVRGKPGSEFRLLTVALMLGNKFLDDNTYTNKTWSDVSGLHVKEIHVMEVEFLSNMRYSLLVSKEEWEAWLAKLARFRMYYERAMASTSTVSPPTNLSPPRPLASPMSSPTTYHNSSAVNNIRLSPGSSANTYQAPSFSPTVSRPNFAPVAAPVQLPSWPGKLPTPQEDAVLNVRSGATKRSMSFEDITEPPPKRSSRFVSPGTTLPPPVPSQAVAPQAGAMSSLGGLAPISSSYGVPTSSLSAGLAAAPAEARRLPAPQLTLNTAAAQIHAPPQLGIQNASAHASFPPVMAMQQQQQAVPQQQLAVPVSQSQVSMALPPPLAHGVRAMATVYPSAPGANVAPAMPTLSTTTGYAVQPPMLPTSGPAMSTPVAPGSGTSTTAYNASQTFGTPTKRTSPMNVLTPSAASVYAAAAANSSPLAESFPHLVSGVHTPTHSPSVYLQQRSSPYRPIRNVHMLLNPPPTTSFQDYQAMGPILIPPTQMYFHPLGRPNDVRPGIVPEFQPYGCTFQQSSLQMPARDVRVQQAQQQKQQQQILAHAQAYANQQSHYNN